MRATCAGIAFVSFIVLFISLLIDEPCLDIVNHIAAWMLGAGIAGVLIGKGY